MSDEQQARDRQTVLDRIGGTERIRILLNTGQLSPSLTNDAIDRVVQLEADERALSDASKAEQMRLARSANTIATQARNAARAALVVATISAIVGIIALFMR
jgi:hypothetical protein